MRRAGPWLLALLPAALTLYLGFTSGGFFPGATGVAAVVLTVAMLVRVTLAERPFAGVSVPVLVAVSALALLAILTLLSALWSGSSARAILEFDRVLVYVLALALLGSLPLRVRRLELAVRGLATALTAICLAGLLSRVAPGVLLAPEGPAPDRLNYPVMYWNAMGLAAVLAIAMCLHLASGPRQPVAVRALSAAAIPALSATLLLTYSRGAIAISAVAVVGYLVLARPWGALGTALAAVPTTAVAVVAAYGARLLASNDPATPAAIAQGHRLAAIIVACAVAAAAVRALLAPVDGRLEREAERRRLERQRAAARARGLRVVAALGAGAAVVAVGVALFFALDVPGVVEREYRDFVATGSVASPDVRDRLASTGNNGRLDNWRVALDGFATAPLLGNGAGTYQLLWSHARQVTELIVLDGHSLYLEVLAELGLVGLALVAVSLLTIITVLIVRCRGPNRSLFAALAAAAAGWAIHAGIDWDWEMPAVTLWLFGVGGMAIAAPPRPQGTWTPAALTRVVAAIGCLLLALTPALTALSQRELRSALAAFQRGDCERTADSALASIRYLGARPQPYELLAYCDVRAGLPDLAVTMMERALARDPDNWEYHYGLALVRAYDRRDPRHQIAAAARLNPRSTYVREAVRAFRTDDPAEWRQRAARARLPIES